MQDEDCVIIVHRLCHLTSTKIEVGNRTKNQDIIVRFKDRSSRDALFTNKVHLKKKAVDLGFSNESPVFINESHSFDTPKILFESEINVEHLATTESSQILVSLKSKLSTVKVFQNG